MEYYRGVGDCYQVLNFTTDCLAWDTKDFKVLILLLFSSEVLMAAIPENLSLLMSKNCISASGRMIWIV